MAAEKNDSNRCSILIVSLQDNGTDSDKPYRVGGMVGLPRGSAQSMCNELLAFGENCMFD